MSDAAVCPWCEQRHDDTFACPQSREVLARLIDKGAKYNQETVELQNAVGENLEGILCLALEVKGFYTETLGVIRPGIAITPVLVDETRLRPLILIDTDATLRRAGDLFQDMSRLAVRRARAAREAKHGPRPVEG